MKALTFHRYGGPEVLQIEEIPTPEPTSNEVRVRMHATSINAGDWHLLRGDPFLVRLMFGLTKPKQKVLGWDIAGYVDKVGPAVTTLKPGDRVFGSAEKGAFAEFVCTPADQLTLLPEDLSLEDAAVTPSAAFTALHGLRDHGRIQAGDEVLVHGASGGVGLFCVSIAKAYDCQVTAVCSGAKAEAVRAAGADVVIDYNTEDVWASGRTYDLIIDTALFGPIVGKRKALKETGRYVIVGGDHFLRNMLFAALTNPFQARKFVNFIAQPNQADLLVLRDLLLEKKLRPHIDRAFPLAEAGEAIRYMEERKVQGKILIRIAPEA